MNPQQRNIKGQAIFGDICMLTRHQQGLSRLPVLSKSKLSPNKGYVVMCPNIGPVGGGAGKKAFRSPNRGGIGTYASKNRRLPGRDNCINNLEAVLEERKEHNPGHRSTFSGFKPITSEGRLPARNSAKFLDDDLDYLEFNDSTTSGYGFNTTSSFLRKCGTEKKYVTQCVERKYLHDHPMRELFDQLPFLYKYTGEWGNKENGNNSNNNDSGGEGREEYKVTIAWDGSLRPPAGGGGPPNAVNVHSDDAKNTHPNVHGDSQNTHPLSSSYAWPWRGDLPSANTSPPPLLHTNKPSSSHGNHDAVSVSPKNMPRLPECSKNVSARTRSRAGKEREGSTEAENRDHSRSYDSRKSMDMRPRNNKGRGKGELGDNRHTVASMQSRPSAAALGPQWVNWDRIAHTTVTHEENDSKRRRSVVPKSHDFSGITFFNESSGPISARQSWELSGDESMFMDLGEDGEYRRGTDHRWSVDPGHRESVIANRRGSVPDNSNGAWDSTITALYQMGDVKNVDFYLDHIYEMQELGIPPGIQALRVVMGSKCGSLAHAFARIDYNSNGELSVLEFAGGISLVCPPLSGINICQMLTGQSERATFKTLDYDNNGTIGLDEFAGEATERVKLENSSRKMKKIFDDKIKRRKSSFTKSAPQNVPVTARSERLQEVAGPTPRKLKNARPPPRPQPALTPRAPEKELKSVNMEEEDDRKRKLGGIRNNAKIMALARSDSNSPTARISMHTAAMIVSHVRSSRSNSPDKNGNGMFGLSNLSIQGECVSPKGSPSHSKGLLDSANSFGGGGSSSNKLANMDKMVLVAQWTTMLARQRKKRQASVGGNLGADGDDSEDEGNINSAVDEAEMIMQKIFQQSCGGYKKHNLSLMPRPCFMDFFDNLDGDISEQKLHNLYDNQMELQKDLSMAMYSVSVSEGLNYDSFRVCLYKAAVTMKLNLHHIIGDLVEDYEGLAHAKVASWKQKGLSGPQGEKKKAAKGAKPKR